MKISALKPATIAVEVFMPYGMTRDEQNKPIPVGRKLGVINMQLLSKHEWEEIGFLVDDPVPPLDKEGKRDFLSMRYQQDKKRVDFKRDIFRLVKALSCDGGIEFECEPDDYEGRAEELEHIDTGVFTALFDQLQVSVKLFEREVDASAESFRLERRKRAVQTNGSKDTDG